MLSVAQFEGQGVEEVCMSNVKNTGSPVRLLRSQPLALSLSVTLGKRLVMV